jgi:hypothetical protein
MSEPIDFQSQIDTLKQQYPGYLDNFKEYYILTKQFPNDDSYTRGYESIRGNMQRASKDLFMINNKIQSEIERLKKITIIINQKISDEKVRNTELQKQYDQSIGEVGGAQTMINDYKKIYFLQYITNVFTFLGAMIVGMSLSITFRRQTNL